MTDPQDTTRHSAVQIALELRRKELAGELPRLQRARDNARDVLTGCVDDVAYVEQQLTELDAALADPAHHGDLVFTASEDLASYARTAKVPAVIVVDGAGVPSLVFVDDDRVRALTPQYGSPVGLSTLFLPVMVVQP